MIDYWYEDGGCLVVHPERSSVVITGGRGTGLVNLGFVVSVSRDRGDSWTRYVLSDSLPGWCHALAPAGPDIVYAGGEVAGQGAVYRSTDLGHTWARTAGELPDTVLSLAVHPEEPGIVYAAAHGLYRTTDAGETWNRLNLPPGVKGLGAVRVHARHPGMVVAGGTEGVAISTDAGETWAEMNQGLDDAPVTWLEFADRGDRLIAASAGRSCFVWTFATGVASGPVPTRPNAALEVRPNPCRDFVNLRWNGLGSPLRARLFDAAGRVVLRRPLPAGSVAIRLNLAGLAPGVYWLDLDNGTDRPSRVSRPGEGRFDATARIARL